MNGNNFRFSYENSSDRGGGGWDVKSQSSFWLCFIWLTGANVDAESVRAEVRKQSCCKAFVRNAPTRTELSSWFDRRGVPDRLMTDWIVLLSCHWRCRVCDPSRCQCILYIHTYTVSQKNWTSSFEHNFSKYCPILIILSLLQTEINYLPTNI